MEVEVRIPTGNGTETITDKRDVTITDTANPFGNIAIVDIEDDEGDNFDKFPFGQRVEIFVRELLTDFEVENADNLLVEETETFTVEETETKQFRKVENQGVVANQGVMQTISDDPRPAFTERFVGYTVEREYQGEGSGRDNLQVTVHSFDQLLRADSVSNDQTGKTIKTALEDIIKEDTAVTWNGSKVTVTDNQELTESLQGEKVEDAILKLAKKSVDEQFGVDDTVEFFFEEQETTSAPADITDSDWIDYTLPERGEENKNETRTFYDNGENVTVVEDGVDQLELQESLGTDDPVVLADDRSRQDFTDTQDAEEDANQNLDDKETARVFEFVAEAEDFLTAKPGQVFDVEIISAGIDDEFRIAELEYNDRSSEVKITAIRNKGNTDDVLRRVTERLRRKELENADFDAPQDRVLKINSAVSIANTPTVDGTDWERTRVTNTLRNQIRDGWGGQGNVSVADIAVGTDPSDLSRTNTGLQNETARASVSETLSSGDTVTYDASFSASNIKEIGLFDGSDNLLYRAVNDSAESPGTVEIELVVNDDSETDKVVVTNGGQESIRDIIADNSPNLPVNYGFGSDQTEPTESDTALGNSLFVADLTEVLIQDANTQSELESLVGSIDSGKPLTVANDKITTQQTCFTTETNDSDGIVGNGSVSFEVNQTDGSSNQDYIQFDSISGGASEVGQTYSFTPNNDISSSDFAVFLRSRPEGVTDAHTVDLDIRGDNLSRTTLATFVGQVNDTTEYQWETFDSSGVEWDLTTDLNAGENYELILTLVDDSGSDKFRFDLIAPVDNQFSYTLDNTLEDQSTDPHLDGPETHPQLVEKLFAETANTRRELDFAAAEVGIDDTSNNQFIELSNDGGNNFIRTNNNDRATANFANPSREVQSRIGLSRFGSRTGETPKTGFNPQQINVWQLFANPRAVVPDGIGVSLTQGLVPRGEITGVNIKELGQLDSNNTTLTRSITAEVNVASDMRVLSAERLTIRQP